MFGPVTTAIRPAFGDDAGEIAIISNKGLAAKAQRGFNDRVAPGFDRESQGIINLGPSPVASRRQFGEAPCDIDHGERVGGGFDRCFLRKTKPESSAKIFCSRLSASSAAEEILTSSSASSFVEKRIAPAIV